METRAFLAGAVPTDSPRASGTPADAVRMVTPTALPGTNSVFLSSAHGGEERRWQAGKPNEVRLWSFGPRRPFVDLSTLRGVLPVGLGLAVK